MELCSAEPIDSGSVTPAEGPSSGCKTCVRRSEESFRALIEGLPDPVFVHHDALVVYVNPAGLSYLRYDDGHALVGRALADSVHSDDFETWIDRLGRFLASGERMSRGDVRFACKDGRIVVAEVTLMPVLFDGEPCILSIARDLTERKGMLAQLRLSDRLASVGTLAAGVAHELNNPLAYIVNNLAHTRRELDRLQSAFAAVDEAGTLDDVRSAICEAELGAGRMQEIIRGLKTFARVDHGQREQCDVEESMESAIRLSWNEIRHKAKLVRSFLPVPRVMGTGVKLEQVFINLLINAAQAIPEGKGDDSRIRVATRKEGDRVVIEISDTGCGIPEDELPCIFDPFFSTKPIGVGTGLGLSVCHGIITNLGGEISVNSTPGQGTTFRVSLPAVGEGERTATSPPPSTGRTPRSRVLIIDDDVLVARSVGRLLGRFHDVRLISNAGDALELLTRSDASRDFDVIFCDLMMPGMTGMDLHRALLEKAPDVAAKMVFATGGAFTARAQEFLDATPNLRIEKPFDFAVLDRTIRAVVGRGVRRAHA
jgi:PAS domain S-box-containing protein